MKKVALVFLAIVFSLAFTLPAKNLNQENNKSVYVLTTPPGSYSGRALVLEKACTICHHSEKTFTGPSFKAIAKKYKGDSKKILEFLEGKRGPIVQPEEFKYMKQVLKQLEKMNNEERKAIAKYIAYFNISN